MITKSIGQHVLHRHVVTHPNHGVFHHEFFEFCHARIHANRIEIFCLTFFIEVNDDPMFSSFRRRIGVQTNKEEIGAQVGNSSEAKIPRKEEAVLLSRDSIACRSAVVSISSRGKVEKDDSVSVDYQHALKFRINYNVDGMGESFGKSYFQSNHIAFQQAVVV